MGTKSIWNGDIYNAAPSAAAQGNQDAMTGIPEVDSWLAQQPVEERGALIQEIFAKPLSGKEVWNKYQQERRNGWRPTVEQFQRMEEYRKDADSEILDSLFMAGSQVMTDFGKAFSKAIDAPADMAQKAIPSTIEGFAQSARDMYGMAAQSEDPGSVLFGFKDLLTGSGTPQSRYKQFLEAADFQHQSERLANGEDTIVFDQRLIDPDFTRAVSYIAEPESLLPFGGIMMKGARAAGLGESMTRAAIRAQQIRTGLLSGAIEWGVGRPAMMLGGALRDSIEYGLQKTSGALESITGVAAEDISRAARLGGIGTAAASVAGHSVPYAAPVSSAYFGGGLLHGFGEASRLVADQVRLQGGHRGLFSFAEQVLEKVDADPDFAKRLSPTTRQMLQVIKKADPILSYAANGAEGAVWGSVIGGGLGYLNAQGEGFGAGVGQGAVLGSGGALIGRGLMDVAGASRRIRESIQSHFAVKLWAEFDKASATQFADFRSDPRVDGKLGQVLDSVAIAIGNVEGNVTFRAPESHAELNLMATEFAMKHGIHPDDPSTGNLTPGQFASNEGWTVLRANGEMFVGVNKELLLRKGNKWAVNTLPHELFHAIVQQGIMGPHFMRVLREEILGEFDVNTGQMLRKGSVDTRELRQFFETYHSRTEGFQIAKQSPAERKEYFRRKKILDSALTKIENTTPQGGPVLTREEMGMVNRLSEEFGAYYYSNWFREKGAEFFLRGGEYDGVKSALNNVKEWWLNHWENRLSVHEPKFDFFRASMNPDGGTALEEGFHKDGNRVRIGSVDRLLTDLTKASAQMKKRGVLDITQLSEGTLKNFIERHGLDELVKKDSQGRSRARKATDEIYDGARLGPEAVKLLDGIDPIQRTSRTLPNGEIEGHLSEFEVQALVVKGYMSNEMGKKVLLFQKAATDPQMGNVVHLSYAGKTMETTVGPGPRLRGNRVPVSYRELIVVDVINSISKDGKFSFRIRALDNKVIKNRQFAHWHMPSVRALWGGDFDAFNKDFHMYLANASKPHTDITRVPSEMLWKDGLGASRRDIMHQVAGFAKADDLSYLNLPIQPIPRGMTSAVGDFSIGRMFNVAFGSTRIPYEHANAFYDISRNFKPATDVDVEILPGGRSVRGTPAGYRIVSQGQTHTAMSPSGEVLGTFTGNSGYSAASDLIQSKGERAVNTFFERAVQSLDASVSAFEKSAKRYEQIVSSIPQENILNFSLNDLFGHVTQLNLDKYGKISGKSKKIPLDKHFVYSTALALGIEGMFKKGPSGELSFERPPVRYENVEIPGHKWSLFVDDSGHVVDMTHETNGKKFSILETRKLKGGNEPLSQMAHELLFNEMLFAFLSKFDGKPHASRVFHGSVHADVLGGGKLNFDPAKSTKNAMHFGFGTQISGLVGPLDYKYAKKIGPEHVDLSGRIQRDDVSASTGISFDENGVVRSPMAHVGWAANKVKVVRFSYADNMMSAARNFGIEGAQIKIWENGTPGFVMNGGENLTAVTRHEFTTEQSMFFDSAVRKLQSQGYDGAIFVGDTGNPSTAIRYVSIPPIGRDIKTMSMDEVANVKTFATNVSGREAKSISSRYYDNVPEISFPGTVSSATLRSLSGGVEASMRNTSFVPYSQTALFRNTGKSGVFKPAPLNVYVQERVHSVFGDSIAALGAMVGITPEPSLYDRDRDGDLNVLPFAPKDLKELNGKIEILRKQWEEANPLLSKEEWQGKRSEAQRLLDEDVAKTRADYHFARFNYRAYDRIEDAMTALKGYGRHFMFDADASGSGLVRGVNEFLDSVYEASWAYENSDWDSLGLSGLYQLGEDEVTGFISAMSRFHDSLGEINQKLLVSTGGLIEAVLEKRTSAREDGPRTSYRTADPDEAAAAMRDPSRKVFERAQNTATERVTFKWSQKAKALQAEMLSLIPNGLDGIQGDWTWQNIVAIPEVRRRLETDQAFIDRQKEHAEMFKAAANGSTAVRQEASNIKSSTERRMNEARRKAGDNNYENYVSRRDTAREADVAESFKEAFRQVPIFQFLADRSTTTATYYLAQDASEIVAKVAHDAKALSDVERILELRNKIDEALKSADGATLEAMKDSLGSMYLWWKNGREHGDWSKPINFSESAIRDAKDFTDLVSDYNRAIANSTHATNIVNITEKISDAVIQHRSAAYEGTFISGLAYGVEQILQKFPAGITAKEMIAEVQKLNSQGLSMADEARITGFSDYLKEKLALPKTKEGKTPKLDVEELRKFIEANKIEPYVTRDPKFDVDPWWNSYVMHPMTDKVGHGSIIVRAKNKQHFPAAGRGSHIMTFETGDTSGGTGPFSDTGRGRDTYAWIRFTDRKTPDGKIVRIIEENQAQNNLDIRNKLKDEMRVVDAALAAVGNDKRFNEALLAISPFADSSPNILHEALSIPELTKRAGAKFGSDFPFNGWDSIQYLLSSNDTPKAYEAMSPAERRVMSHAIRTMTRLLSDTYRAENNLAETLCSNMHMVVDEFLTAGAGGLSEADMLDICQYSQDNMGDIGTTTNYVKQTANKYIERVFDRISRDKDNFSISYVEGGETKTVTGTAARTMMSNLIADRVEATYSRMLRSDLSGEMLVGEALKGAKVRAASVAQKEALAPLFSLLRRSVTQEGLKEMFDVFGRSVDDAIGRNQSRDEYVDFETTKRKAANQKMAESYKATVEEHIPQRVELSDHPAYPGVTFALNGRETIHKALVGLIDSTYSSRWSGNFSGIGDNFVFHRLAGEMVRTRAESMRTSTLLRIFEALSEKSEPVLHLKDKFVELVGRNRWYDARDAGGDEFFRSRHHLDEDVDQGAGAPNVAKIIQRRFESHGHVNPGSAEGATWMFQRLFHALSADSNKEILKTGGRGTIESLLQRTDYSNEGAYPHATDMGVIPDETGRQRLQYLNSVFLGNPLDAQQALSSFAHKHFLGKTHTEGHGMVYTTGGDDYKRVVLDDEVPKGLYEGRKRVASLGYDQRRLVEILASDKLGTEALLSLYKGAIDGTFSNNTSTKTPHYETANDFLKKNYPEHHAMIEMIGARFNENERYFRKANGGKTQFFNDVGEAVSNVMTAASKAKNSSDANYAAAVGRLKRVLTNQFDLIFGSEDNAKAKAVEMLNKLEKIPFLEGKEYFPLLFKALVRSAVVDGVDYITLANAADNGTASGLRMGKAIGIYESFLPSVDGKYAKKKGLPLAFEPYSLDHLKLRDDLTPEQQQKLRDALKAHRAYRDDIMGKAFAMRSNDQHEVEFIPKPETVAGLSELYTYAAYEPETRDGERKPRRAVTSGIFFDMANEVSAEGRKAQLERHFATSLNSGNDPLVASRGSSAGRSGNTKAPIVIRDQAMHYLAGTYTRLVSEKITDPAAIETSIKGAVKNLKAHNLSPDRYGIGRTVFGNVARGQGYWFRSDSKHLRGIESLKGAGIEVRKVATDGVEIPGFVRVYMKPDWSAHRDFADGSTVYKRWLAESLERKAISKEAFDAGNGLISVFDAFLFEADLVGDMFMAVDPEKTNTTSMYMRGHTWDIKGMSPDFAKEVSERGQTAFKPAPGEIGGADISMNTRPFKSGFITETAEKFSSFTNGVRLRFERPRNDSHDMGRAKIVLYPRGVDDLTSTGRNVEFSAVLDQGTRTATGFADHVDDGGSLAVVARAELALRLRSMGYVKLDGDFRSDSFVRPEETGPEPIRSEKPVAPAKTKPSFKLSATPEDERTTLSQSLMQPQTWTSAAEGTGLTVTSMDGYIISFKDKKFRLFDSDKALIGVYESEEEAKRKASKHAAIAAKRTRR